jgi:hypothetical protein
MPNPRESGGSMCKHQRVKNGREGKARISGLDESFEAQG